MTFISRASVLSEVQTNRSSHLPANQSLLLLGTVPYGSLSNETTVWDGLLTLVFVPGDKESGKTTLIAKLQGNEDPKKGAALEYCYVDVRDEYRDGEFPAHHSSAKLETNGGWRTMNDRSIRDNFTKMARC